MNIWNNWISHPLPFSTDHRITSAKEIDGDTTPSIDYNRQTITDGGASHVINHFDQSVKSALKTNKCPLSGRLSTGQGRSKKMKCLNFQMKKKSDGFVKTSCIRLNAVWNEICIFILSFKVVLLADTGKRKKLNFWIKLRMFHIALKFLYHDLLIFKWLNTLSCIVGIAGQKGDL